MGRPGLTMHWTELGHAGEGKGRAQETPRAAALGRDAPESKVRGAAEWTGKEVGWGSGRRGDGGLRRERTEGRGGLPTLLPEGLVGTQLRNTRKGDRGSLGRTDWKVPGQRVCLETPGGGSLGFSGGTVSGVTTQFRGLIIPT